MTTTDFEHHLDDHPSPGIPPRHTPPEGVAMVRTVFHADLSDAHPGEDYWIHAGGKRYPLVAHTADTLAELRRIAPHMEAMPDARLTHYTGEAVELPRDFVVRVHIKHTLRTFPGAQGKDGVHHVAMHIPGRLAARLPDGSPDFGSVAHHPIDWISTAKALIFHHADLINNNPETSNIIYDYMDNNSVISSEFETLAERMRQMGPPAEARGWALLVPYTPPKNQETKQDGTTTYYFHQPQDAIQTAAGGVTTLMMMATKNDNRLKGKKWTLQEGTSVTSAPGSSNPDARVLLASVSTAAGAAGWKASLQNSQSVYGLQTIISIKDASRMQLQVTLNNTFIRYLGAYVRFFDAEGKAISVPHWSPDEAPLTTTIIKEVMGPDVQYDDMRFLGYVGPVNNILAIPIVSDPGVLQVTITFPANAVSASIYGSGLGTGSDAWPKSPIVGGVLTGLLNLGVPAFMLAFAVAAQSYKPLYDIVDELSSNKKFVGAVLSGGALFFGANFGVAASHKQMDWKSFATLAKLLFDPAATKAMLWIEASMAGEEAAEQIPFAGWIMIAVNIATGLAQMAETIIEVAISPWNIENRIATSITTAITIKPDPRHHAFPQAPAGSTPSYTVKMIYKDQKRPTVSTAYSVPATTPATLAASFPNNTLGGQVKFEVSYYIDQWLAAKATTGWMENDEVTVSDLTLILIQFPIPLTEKSIYRHTAILTYQNGAYAWMPSSTAPTATVANRNTSSSGNAISDWTALTLSQKLGMIGFGWKAAGMGIASCVSGETGQLYAIQNIDIPGTAMKDVKFSNCGFDGQSELIDDPFPPKFLMVDGQWKLDDKGQPVPDPADAALGNYYIDPRQATVDLTQGGGFHLRSAGLDQSGPFPTGATGQLSHGRFPYFPDSFALHPSGHMIGVSSLYKKIMIARLDLQGAADTDIPVAQSYAGEAFTTDRLGLLFSPAAVTCAYDGTILVLEDTKSSQGGSTTVVSRVQAFDLFGNPVNRFFDDRNQPSPFLHLDGAATKTYLDVAAVGDEKMTYIYVLYYEGDGAAASDYHLAIYQYGVARPARNPLVTTDSFAAAKIAVDMWHTVYALNYQMTTDANGQPAGPSGGPAAGPAGRTAPSVSEWLPPVQS